MQTEKELFDLMKEAYPLQPREEFVSDTSNKLRQKARKLNRNRRMKQFSLASTSIALCVIAISWFFFYGGKDVISSNHNTLQERNSATSVKNQDPLVYIYQSHDKESFFAELNTKVPADQAFHDTKNITLVGERLSQSLKKAGIPAIHDETQVMQILKEGNLPFNESYKVSREPLKDAIEKNKSIKMVFDLHRDSQKRSVTTSKIDGIEYAKIAFIVSGSSSNYEENVKFATLLHNKIQKEYPNSLSRGVLVKNNPPNQNTYNQDFLDHSVLVEIGGVENTLEEEYRTADILADMIKEILSDQTK
ncbi:stage II sporulation protein P [Bacillus sp. SLBN-46]|uniref:stage II sporulation protein P n=1 Tax=Bacillus sp. SLBN-46 TaxID=3042283 RepID=UPI00285E68C2|nr:stage II sporulation protein P [Bacillus sp. SLBN-46]MDR6121267.1 stage II sporulation protein P [Bacillus sp. SLBN-46]